MKRAIYASLILISMGIALFELIQYKDNDFSIEWYKEANMFKRKCLMHQDSLITLQYLLIESLSEDSINIKSTENYTHLIKEQQEILDSLYTTEL